MKRILGVMGIVVLAGTFASAGIVRFTAKHVVKPAAKASVKVVKVGAHVAVVTAKTTKKVVW